MITTTFGLTAAEPVPVEVVSEIPVASNANDSQTNSAYASSWWLIPPARLYRYCRTALVQAPGGDRLKEAAASPEVVVDGEIGLPIGIAADHVGSQTPLESG
jgi:hypothetical protein